MDGVRPVASEFFLVCRQLETEALSNFVPTEDSVRPVTSEFFLVCRQLETEAKSNPCPHMLTAPAHVSDV